MTTPFTAEQIGKLASPLMASRVSKRRGGGGSSLSYLEAYDVKATLIRVFGFGNFSADVIESEIVQIFPVPDDPKKFTVLAKATVRIRIHATDATYTETAASSQTGSQGVGEVADFALKTAESDALKRAAIYLGTQFGLSLYNNGTTNDVVGVILEPEQKALLEESRAAQAEASKAAEETVQARMKHATPRTDAVIEEAKTEPSVEEAQ